MKKLSFILSLPVVAVIGLSSCNADKEPKIDTTTDFEFVLNTPQLATQFIDLSTNGNIQFTVSQPNYGVTVVPTYGIEISLKPDFTPITTEPVVDSEGETHVVPGVYALNLDSQLRGILVSKMSDIAAGINELEGLYDQDSYVEKYGENGGYVGPIYVRSTAFLGAGNAATATATVSNVITLSQVQGYASFPSSEVFLSVPGGANGWNHLPQIIYAGDSDSGAMICKGFAVVDGEFKVTDGDWDGSGNWGTNDGLTVNPDGTFSATLIQNSQSNFNGNGEMAAGLYYFYVELTDMKNGSDNAEVGTMTITPIKSVSLPGDYNGWDVTSGEMAQDGNYFTWSGSAAVTSAGWKFAMNNDWAINLGGDPNELSFDGANLTLEGSTITLNLEQYPWSCTVQ